MIKRMFLAINLPIEIKEELFKLVEKLTKRNKNKPVKWVEQDNFHLTLHFFGEVDEDQLAKIEPVLESVISQFSVLKFNLTEKMEAFPNLDNPRVVFLEINELDNGQVFKLQRQLENALANAGLVIDKRPFRLHLTLGRVKSKTSLSLVEIDFDKYKFEIASIDLMESQLTPSGPIYNIFKKYDLKI